MLDNEKLLFDELYEKTKDCGRVQFVELLMTKERENKELKLQLKGTTHCFDEEEHEKLKKQLENYKKLGFKHLQDQNVELNKKYENAVADYETTMFEKEQLKKQLEENKDKINWYENFEINKTIDKLRIKHNNQQKEFIKWLETMNRMYQNEYKDIDTAEHYNCVLRKYKEIIGG